MDYINAGGHNVIGYSTGDGSLVGTSEGRIERTVALLLLAALAAGCFLVLLPFLAPILWALIIALVTWPAFRRVETALKGRRTLAASLMILSLVAILLVPMIILAASLAEDAAGFVQRVRAFFAEGTPAAPEWLAGLPIVGGKLAAIWRDVAEGTISMGQYIPKAIQPVGNWLVQAGARIGQAVFELCIGLITLFFLYRDGAEAGHDLVQVADRIAGEQSHRVLGVASGTMKGVVYGTVGTALAQGLLTGVGLAITQVPGATVLGTIAGFAAFFPAGPILVWAPAAFWLLVQGHFISAIFLVAWGGVAVGMSDNVLKPIFIGRETELHFLMILLGLLGGMLAFGFLGIFLGPTLLAVGHSIMTEWMRAKAEDLEPET